MSQTPMFFVEIFDVRGIDFISPFPMSFDFVYINLAVDYVCKWVEAKITWTNDSKVASDFIKSNIFVCFGMPRAIVSDRGMHFCNKTIAVISQVWCVPQGFNIIPPPNQWPSGGIESRSQVYFEKNGAIQ